MVKKVIQVGNSLGITLSSVFVKSVRLKAGDLVEVPEADIVPTRVKKGKKALAKGLEGVTPEFVSLVEETIRDYKPALHALSKK